MESFQSFLFEARIQDFGIGFPLQLVINTLVMWWVVNRLEDVGERISLLRCAVCALLLHAVSGAAISMLFLPVTLVLVGALLVWLFGSLLVIQSVFQLHKGTGSIFFYYLLVLLGVWIIVRSLPTI